MIRKILVIMTVIASITDSTECHHHDEDRRIHRLLKEAKKQQRLYASQGSNGGGNYNFGSGSSQFPQFQFPNNGGSNSGGGGSSGGGGGGSDSPPHPILTPGSGGGSSGGSGNFGTIGSSISGVIPPAGGSSSNYPPLLPNFPSGSQIVGQLGLNPELPQRPHYPIEQVNRGVNTILNGVRSLDLGQILRGAFVFPRNENVRSVANNVIDTIFGAARQPAGEARSRY